MEKDDTEFVWEDMRPLGEETILKHFPNIFHRCMEEGFDPRKEPIPVVPAQHYFMGGIKVDYESKTSMDRLYAVGETACNGVHGRNRLASNSLLESLVFAKRAAHNMTEHELSDILDAAADEYVKNTDINQYQDEEKLDKYYSGLVRKKIDEADAAMKTA